MKIKSRLVDEISVIVAYFIKDFTAIECNRSKIYIYQDLIRPKYIHNLYPNFNVPAASLPLSSLIPRGPWYSSAQTAATTPCCYPLWHSNLQVTGWSFYNIACYMNTNSGVTMLERLDKTAQWHHLANLKWSASVLSQKCLHLAEALGSVMSLHTSWNTLKSRAPPIFALLLPIFIPFFPILFMLDQLKEAGVSHASLLCLGQWWGGWTLPPCLWHHPGKEAGSHLLPSSASANEKELPCLSEPAKKGSATHLRQRHARGTEHLPFFHHQQAGTCKKTIETHCRPPRDPAQGVTGTLSYYSAFSPALPSRPPPSSLFLSCVLFLSKPPVPRRPFGNYQCNCH